MTSSQFSKITIDVLRHGQCDDGKIYRGRTDSALSAQGWQQLKLQCQQPLERASWQQIISSPKQRCLSFSHYLSDHLQIPTKVENAFSEYDFGDWDGQLIADIWQQYPTQAQAFYDNPKKNRPPNAESMSHFLHRTLQGWQHLAKEFNHQHILLITHAGVIRALLCQLLEIPIHKQMSVMIDYGSLTRIITIKTASKRWSNLLIGRLPNADKSVFAMININ